MRRLALIAWLPAVAFAQADVIPQGHAVASLNYIRSDTDSRFDFLGEHVRVIPPAGPLFQGRALTNVLALDLAYGMWRKVDVHVTVPLAFSSQPSVQADGSTIRGQEASPSSAGLSNVRVGARYNFFTKPFSLTFKFDVKLPASVPDLEAQFNGTTLPIREGQTDYDFSGQASRSFQVGDRALMIGGEAGYRYRSRQAKGALDTFTRAALAVKPGDELIYNFRVTYALLRRVTASLNADGIAGADFSVPFRFTRVGDDGSLRTVGTQGSVPPGFTPDYLKQSGRRIFSLGPMTNIRVTRRTYIGGGVLFALAGRNYPAGRFYVLGITRILR